MSDLLTGIVKGLSGFMPQDDPDVKIFNAQTEVKETAEKMEKIFARLGKQVYEAGGSEAYPEVKAELDLLTANHEAAERRLQEAKDEKAAAERAKEEERQRREAEEAAHSCPNCGAYNPEGTNFCQECGTKLGAVASVTTKRFCQECGAELPAGSRFCGSCGAKVSEL